VLYISLYSSHSWLIFESFIVTYWFFILGTIPSSLQSATKLTTLYLAYNSLTGALIFPLIDDIDNHTSSFYVSLYCSSVKMISNSPTSLFSKFPKTSFLPWCHCYYSFKCISKNTVSFASSTCSFWLTLFTRNDTNVVRITDNINRLSFDFKLSHWWDRVV
jgi:hypothetical protein